MAQPLAPRIAHVIKAAPRRTKLALCTAGAVVLAVGAVALVIKWAPDWLASTEGLKPADRAAEIGRVRTSLLAILAGGIAIVGAIYTAKTFALNRQSHITERFTRAIDQLGSQQIDIRLGGIYALERIARESAVDHPPIMEILTGFLREHSPGEAGEDDGSPDEVGTDIQAALSVIAQRRVEYDGPRGLNFDGVDLPRAEFHGTNLVDASFRKANLSGARLSEVNLKGARFSGARLERSFLERSNLEDAFWIGANFRGAHMTDVKLANARPVLATNFDKSDLRDADLRGVDLSGASFVEAILDGVKYDDQTRWPADFDNETLTKI